MTLTEQSFLILTAIAEEPRHGYGIIKEVSILSQDQVKLGAGTLYGALDRLCEARLVTRDREEIECGRLRRFYKLTDRGIERLRIEVERRSLAVRAAHKRLAAWPHAESTSVTA